MNIYLRRRGSSPIAAFHLLQRAVDGYAYTFCGQIHNMRASESETSLRAFMPFCGVCKRQAEPSAAPRNATGAQLP